MSIRLTDEVKSRISSGEIELLYHTKVWESKRESILLRDHYECQRCLGVYKAGEDVRHIRITRANTVHHILEAREYPYLILDDDNLISLCHRCHDIVHGRVPKFFNKPKPKLTDEKW